MPVPDAKARAAELLEESRRGLHRRIDRQFAGLLLAEWVACIALALLVSPKAWEGRDSALHPNVLTAAVLGAVICSLPVLSVVRRPGEALTRHLVVAAQALFAGLLIHLTGGRIETHFLFFGQLAFAAFYRDWRVLVTFSAVAGAYHMLGSYVIPLEVYGLAGGAEWRWVEHVWWVVFEDAFLIAACIAWDREMHEVAERQATLESVNARVEHQILMPLRSAAGALAGSSENLLGHLSEQKDAVLRQAAALQEAQVTASEIRQTVEAAAQMAGTVLAGADRADEAGRSGEAAIGASLAGFGEIHAQVLEMAGQVRRVSERTRKVQSITDSVKELADQSNMLALNAAIEAVRSGEHGRGFAVVAREIRALADQSINATQEVRQVLDGIGDAVRTAAESGDRGAAHIERGLEQIRASGDRLRELAGALSGMSQNVRQIAAAVTQQGAGVTQLASVISELSSLMEETRQRLEASDEAVAVVSRAAVQVREVSRLELAG